MSDVHELRARLHDIHKYLTDSSLIELSGHLTQFLELFVKLYIQKKDPKHEPNLDKELGQLRAIADDIERMPPNISWQLENCQKFRNKIAHNRITDKIRWGEDFFDTIKSGCCTLFSFAESDFSSVGTYIGATMNLSRKTYDTSTFSGRRQKEYDELWGFYDDFEEFMLGDLWDTDGDQLSTKEEYEELTDEEEMRLDDIYQVMEVIGDMKDKLAMVLAQYEESYFGIEHKNRFSEKREEILNRSAKRKSKMAEKNTDILSENFKIQDLIMTNKISDTGEWEHFPGSERSLLGLKFSIPGEIRPQSDPELQEIIAISDANSYLKNCPNCGDETSGCLLTTGYTMIYPAKCCDKFCYIVNSSKPPNFEE